MLSNDLLLKRAGNFTASENHRLMAGWQEKKTPREFDEFKHIYRAIRHLDKKPLVGDVKNKVKCNVSGDLINLTWKIIQEERPPQGLVTYAQEKAIEEFFHPDPSLNFSTQHTRNGEEREHECMAMLSEKTGIEFVHTGGDQIHIHADEVGCTPDGLKLDELDLVETGAEAKCKSALVHAQNMMVKNNNDMKSNIFDAFVQVQTAMLVTGADHWYFANYNPFAKDERLIFGHIIVERDDRFIAILNERLEMAKAIKAEFYKKIEQSINN